MTSTSFTTAGAHTYTVPSGAETVLLKCWGAGGGDAKLSGSGATDTTTGADGGYAEGSFSVSPGDSLTVIVGGAGPTPSSATDNVGGGTRTGGAGAQASQTGDVASGGGGGSSEVRYPNDQISDRIIVAPGGAGGAATFCSNGNATSDAGASGGGGQDGGATADGSPSGGSAGGASGASGEDGSSFSGSGDVDIAVAGGGAGGGANGGAAGSLSTNTVSPGNAEVGGSAGGGFDTASVSSATTTDAGGNSNTGKVTVDAPPAAPSGLSASASGTDVALSWTDNSSTESGFRVYRATSSGTQLSDYSQVADLAAGTTSHTDSAPTEGEKFYYRVSAYDSVGESRSGETTATTDLPAPSGLSVSTTNGDQLACSWTDNATDEDGYRIFLSTDGGNTYTQEGSDQPADTTSFTTSSKLDGTTYTVQIRAFTSHTTSSSSAVDETTVLPDANQPGLDNGTEDQIGVDRGAQVHDNGSVRWQVRETGESSWSGSAAGFAENTVAFDTISFTITGREDGEEYEVRLRTETPDVNGAWTTPVSVITKFPAPTGLSATATGTKSIDLSWTDNADNEDAFKVERQKTLQSGNTSSFKTVATKSPNTTTHTDTQNLQPNRTYTYRIRATTDDTDALSNEDSATTDSTSVRQVRAPSAGWYMEIDI